MMKKALKITFGTVLAGVVTTACATPDNLLQHTAIHANGTYTRATSNGTSYGDLMQQGNGAAGANFGKARASFVHPKAQWDWGAGLTYHVPGTLTRVFFHYDHFNDSNNTESATGLSGLGINADNVGAMGVNTVTDRSQEYTLGLDRRIEVGPRFYLDAGAFIEWDKVHRNSFQSHSAAGAFATLDVNNKLRGFGPGVGVKGHATPFSNYNGFGIFASALTTLLYAKNNFDWSYKLNDNIGVLDPDETHSIVSKLDISLGLDYNCPLRLDGRSKMQLGVTLGARYVNYINAFKNGNVMPSPTALAATAGYSLDVPATAEDWGRVGPFLQVRIGGGHS